MLSITFYTGSIECTQTGGQRKSSGRQTTAQREGGGGTILGVGVGIDAGVDGGVGLGLGVGVDGWMLV